MAGLWGLAQGLQPACAVPRAPGDTGHRGPGAKSQAHFTSASARGWEAVGTNWQIGGSPWIPGTPLCCAGEQPLLPQPLSTPCQLSTLQPGRPQGLMVQGHGHACIELHPVEGGPKWGRWCLEQMKAPCCGHKRSKGADPAPPGKGYPFPAWVWKMGERRDTSTCDGKQHLWLVTLAWCPNHVGTKLSL